jgi:hypothetical protein
MFKKIVVTAFLFFAFVLPGFAFVIDGNIYTSGVSRYIWRGEVLNDGPALQSGVCFGAEGVSLQLWTSCQQMASPDLFDEVDLYANYEHSIPGADFLTLGAGYASYMLAPYDFKSTAPSQEYSITLKSDIISSPYISFFHSMDAATTYNHMEAGVSYEYGLGEMLGGKNAAGAAASLGIDLNQVTDDWVALIRTEETALTVAVLNIYYNYEIAGFTVTPSVFLQLNVNEKKLYKNFATASLVVNYAFSIGESGEKTEPAKIIEKTEVKEEETAGAKTKMKMETEKQTAPAK